MTRHFPRTIARSLILAVCLPFTGCVVGEIRDEMVTTNQLLTQVEEQLELIEEANILLEGGSDRLGDVQQRLDRIASIDASLESIDASLKRLDEHLASLRATIENIDSTIPFLSISDGPEDTEGQPGAITPADQPAPGESPE